MRAMSLQGAGNGGKKQGAVLLGEEAIAAKLEGWGGAGGGGGGGGRACTMRSCDCDCLRAWTAASLLQ